MIKHNETPKECNSTVDDEGWPQQNDCPNWHECDDSYYSFCMCNLKAKWIAEGRNQAEEKLKRFLDPLNKIKDVKEYLETIENNSRKQAYEEVLKKIELWFNNLIADVDSENAEADLKNEWKICDRDNIECLKRAIPINIQAQIKEKT